MNQIPRLARFAAWALLLCAAAMPAWLQGQAAASSFVLQHANLQPRITCLAQHSRGYLIAGSQAGLYLFDGATFKACTIDSSIGSTHITALYEVRPGEVWVGFYNGAVGLLKLQHVQKLRFEEGQFAKPVTRIVTDSMRRVWCGTAGEGVYLLNNNRWINFNTDDGLADAYVYDLALCEGNAVAAGTDAGVHELRYAGGKKLVRVLGSRQGLADNICKTLMQLNGSLLIGHYSNGLSIIPAFRGGVAHSLHSNEGGWPFGEVNAMAIDRGRLLLATSQGGLLQGPVPPGGMPGPITLVASSPHGINALLVQPGGLVWYAENNVLHRLTDGILRPYSLPGLLAPASIGAACQAANGQWYLGEGSRLFAWNAAAQNSMLKQIPLPGIGSSATITSLCHDKSENLIVGTMGEGLWKVDAATGRTNRLCADAALHKMHVLSITCSKGTAWISTLEGVMKATADDKGSYTCTMLNDLENIGTNYVYQVIEDSKGRVWFATDGKGLTLLDKGRYTHFSSAQGLGSNVVYRLAEDRNGCLWMNTLNDGLYCYNGRGFMHLTTAQGLSDNSIGSIVADGSGNIVATSAKGVDVIDATTLAIRHLDATLDVSQVNTGLHSLARSRQGEVLFFTAQGVCLLPPSSGIKPPAAYIDHCELFLNDIEPTDTSFAAGENNFGIHFNAVDLLHPYDLQFQYMLEGFNKEWITTRDRYINFPRLPAGRYSFKVRASATGYFAASPVASWSFVIAWPLWMRWWFWVLCAAALGMAIWQWMRYRERQLNRLQQMKQQHLQSQLETLKTQVSPHFFFNSLNTLMALIEENPKVAVTYTQHLSDFFRKIVILRNRDTIPLEEELSLIEEYFHIQQQRFGQSLRLVNLLPAATVHNRQVAPLTLQLLAENAIKHNAFTEKEPLVVTLSQHDEWLEVSNNLAPKQTPEAGAGMGLQNIRHRYQLLGKNDIQVEKASDHFVVRLPLI